MIFKLVIMKKFLLASNPWLIFIVLAQFFPIEVNAMQFQYGDNLVINVPTFENLYVAGRTVTINAPVHGDIIITGGTVIIQDSIFGDVLMAGGNIQVKGYIDGDIRSVGGDIRITSVVTGDVLVGCGSITIESGSQVGNLILGSGKAIIEGRIMGNVFAYANEFVLDGSIGKQLDCKAVKITIDGEVTGESKLSASTEMIITSKAAFNQTIRYWLPGHSIAFPNGKYSAIAKFDDTLKMDTKRWYKFGLGSFMLVLWYLGMALITIIFVEYFFPRVMQQASFTAQADSIKSFFRGLLYFILTPISIFILFVTVVGIPLAFTGLVLFMLTLLLASSVISVVAAHWYNHQYNKQLTFWQLILTAFGFFIAFRMIGSLPFFGWMLTALMTCIVFGAILLNVKWVRSGHA
jgi:cytoskeletal protein CcmA (bactofilin family)